MSIFKRLFSKQYKGWIIGLAIAFISVIVLYTTGSYGDDNSKKIGIYTLSIDAATGNKENNNCISLVNDYENGQYNKYKYDAMTNETALMLINEINSLPDVFGNKDEPFAYSIRLQYYDETHNLIQTEKMGYGSFPDNWGWIVSYTNLMTPQRLTDSTDIVIIDADHLRKEFGVTDDMLPEDVTVERFLEETGLSYVELYSPYFRMDTYIRQYIYGYYDLASHRITEDTAASVSGEALLKEYAEENLDNIVSINDISIKGLYKGYEFEIVRFDCYEDWKTQNDVGGNQTDFDGTLNIYYEMDAGLEDMKYTEVHYVYVDKSNRFLIITQCEDYSIINEFFTQ